MPNPSRGLKSVDWRLSTGKAEQNALRPQYLDAVITQPFGPSTLPGEPAYAGYPHFHKGTDLVLDGPNGLPTAAPIRSPASGTVIKSGWNGGFGNSVTILGANGFTYLFGHMSNLHILQKKNGNGGDEQSPNTAVGDKVYAGEIIGWQGSTGYSTGPHLHLEIHDTKGVPVDLGKNNGQVMGSLFHGLGFGGGYLPGTYGMPPDPDNNQFPGSPFILPVPLPLQTGSNDPFDPTGPDPKPIVPIDPGTGQPAPFNPADPYGYNNPLNFGGDIFSGVAGAATSLVVGAVGLGVLLIGLLGLVLHTDAGQQAKVEIVNGAKTAVKAAMVAA